eukprot:CAMPEP_0196660510 /NCGR_PEP_ID=MMETSP1086-20130531/40124_1 /TAXON_ID=77921 /ORGANISM="Cyanoptyche  gloeocystis , Strain SAG4.97" /LENGTH=397 /DNA_ID=CAMNT_0041994955 /DNA_START=176 /DNA_END=1370 /DNA_ORIENTATION=-
MAAFLRMPSVAHHHHFHIEADGFVTPNTIRPTLSSLAPPSGVPCEEALPVQSHPPADITSRTRPSPPGPKVLLLSPGRYTGDLIIKSSVVLMGLGPPSGVHFDEGIIVKGGASVKVHNASFGHANKWKDCLVSVQEGSMAVLQAVQLTCSERAIAHHKAVHVHGPNSRAVLKSCTLTSGADHDKSNVRGAVGVRVSSSGHVEIEYTKFREFATAVVVVGKLSRAVLTGCDISYEGFHGERMLSVSAGGELVAVRNEFRQTGGTVLHLEEGSRGELRQNNIQGYCGVDCEDSCLALRDNRVRAMDPVKILGNDLRTRAEIEGNVIESTDSCGVYVIALDSGPVQIGPNRYMCLYDRNRPEPGEATFQPIRMMSPDTNIVFDPDEQKWNAVAVLWPLYL